MAGAAAGGRTDASTPHTYHLPFLRRRGIGPQACRLFRRARRPLRRLTAQKGGAVCWDGPVHRLGPASLARCGSAVAADGGATAVERRKWALGGGRIGESGPPRQRPSPTEIAPPVARPGTGRGWLRGDGHSTELPRGGGRILEETLHGPARWCFIPANSETLVRGPAPRLGPVGAWPERKASPWSGVPVARAPPAVTTVAAPAAEAAKPSGAAAATPARWSSAVEQRRRWRALGLEGRRGHDPSAWLGARLARRARAGGLARCCVRRRKAA